MEQNNEILNKQFYIASIVLAIFIIGCIASYYRGFDQGVKSVSVAVVADTTYSKVKIDSITKLIDEGDTTIYQIKVKLKDDVEKSYALTDSASVELFKRLVTSK